jgi:hypothetical protein
MQTDSEAHGIIKLRSNTMSGKVIAVNISEKKGEMKKPIPVGNFIEDFGLEGVAHAGQ